MLKLEAWMDIKNLHRQGPSIRTITELTGLARNTVWRVLREQAPRAAKKRGRRSQLDPFKPYLEQHYNECALSDMRLLEEIRVMGYTGGIDVVRRFIHALDLHTRSQAKMPANASSQTRVVLYATGLRPFILSSSLIIRARTDSGSVFVLPIDYAGIGRILPGLDQVIVRLTPELAGASQVTLSIDGVTYGQVILPVQ
jgi:hypothetical protein